MISEKQSQLTDRQEEILNALIREYISGAEPISSKLLKEKANLDVSPATIRNDFQELTEAGYIAQPHTSAGRIPTEKAYKYFVDKSFADEKQLLSEFKSEISKQLSELNTLANNQNKDEFLNLQEKILTEIGIQYSGISLSEFTENDAAQKLKEKFGDTADRWKMLLLDCKSSKYGLGAPNIDLNSRYAETENLWKSFQK